jgi:hypothetical protein
MKSIDINNPILASADEAASIVLNQAMFAYGTCSILSIGKIPLSKAGLMTA